MTKTEIKQYAQDEIMVKMAGTLLSFLESQTAQDMPEEEREAVKQEIIKQADRVAKMFGYREAWHD